MKILVLTDDKAGHIGQARAIFDSIKIDKIFFICKKINFWKKLFKDTNNYELENILNYNLNISFIVAVSANSLDYAVRAKKILSRYNQKVIIFYLMPPTNLKYKLKNIDYICYHSYKDYKKYKDDAYTKYIKIDLPPSHIKDKISATKNIIMVNIGGDAKGIKFDIKSLDEMLKKIINSKFYKEYKYDVIIFNSRRTSALVDDAIYETVQNNNRLQFINYKKDILAKDKYSEILKTSKVIIVTYESSSMVADAVSLPFDRKVFLYRGPFFKHKRYCKMLDVVEEKKYGYNIDKIDDINSMRYSYNSNNFILDTINKIIYE